MATRRRDLQRGLALPMVLGIAAALPLYKLLAPNKKFLAFALFMGVAMSITAFPVLARILSERRMLKRPLGALALSAAAIDDVTAWFLIALATAVAAPGRVSATWPDDRLDRRCSSGHGVRGAPPPGPRRNRLRRGRPSARVDG